MNTMRPAELEAVIRYARAVTTVASERILTYLGFLAASAIFGFAMWEPDWKRAATASLFAVLVYWPAVRLESAQKQAAQQGE